MNVSDYIVLWALQNKHNDSEILNLKEWIPWNWIQSSLCVLHAFFYNAEEHLESPKKVKSEHEFQFHLAYWSGLSPQINTLTKPCYCLLLSRKTMLSLLWKRDYQYIWNYIFSSCPLTSYNRLTLGTDSVGFHSANKILIKETHFYLSKENWIILLTKGTLLKQHNHELD